MFSWSERARRNAARRAPAGIMREFLLAPLPTGKTPCREAAIVALDLETTGLDARHDRILSIATVPVRDMAVVLAEAWQASLNIDGDLPEKTVVIHGITDDQAAGGRSLAEILPQLLQRLCGKVLLVHNAALDRAFLDRACRQLYNVPCLLPVIDTQALARRQHRRRDLPIKSGDLRLYSLRERYGLPRYGAHRALNDALATAELFLAMAAEMSPTGNCRLRDVMTRWY